MWKRLIDFVVGALSIMQRQERQEKRQKDQEEEIKRLTHMVTLLANELQRAQDQIRHHAQLETSEREKLMLKIENRLLKEKLNLPPQTEEKQDSEEH